MQLSTKTGKYGKHSIYAIRTHERPSVVKVIQSIAARVQPVRELLAMDSPYGVLFSRTSLSATHKV